MPKRKNVTPTKSNGQHSKALTVLVVEHRDEIFARLAADVERLGLDVLRAESAEQALRLVGTCDLSLLIANRDLPGQNGWVLADKLRLASPHVETWLYMPDASTYAEILALFVNVTDIVAYRGDLLSLSDSINYRLAERCRSASADTDEREPAAA